MPTSVNFHPGEDRLSVGLLMRVCQQEVGVEIARAAREKIDQSRSYVDQIVESNKVVYGINTGFGPLCNTQIAAGDTRKLQDNILRSHSVGVGAPVPLDIVRLMLITKLQSLSQGYSGISTEVLERMIWHLTTGYLPYVPSQGSVGASGDLAPLAHMFLPLIGLGKVWDGNNWVETGLIFQKEGIKPIELGAKEGLALINGTQFIASFAVLGLYRLHNLLETADIIGAMSLEGVLGSASPFDPALHLLRAFQGSTHVAHRLKIMLQNSEMVESHANCGRVQDPYSFRCMPQVHGASRNAWLHLKELTEIEINSVTDNPVIFSADKTISGGNFHGQLLAMPLDYATLAAAEIGSISDRRTYQLLEGDVEGLPKLLMRNTGINSGFMIPQYTSAALVSENKSLCFPASADSIPTSLGQEDHVSMGSISGRKLNTVLDNLENILAVELVCAAQAFDYRKPMKSGVILDACHELVRQKIDHAEEDRIFGDDIAVAREIVASGELTSAALEVAQSNNINLKGDLYESFSLS
ncbi:MAG: histidine ammonia-lyase [Imperialibacter sp.]|uniref:histidine ammonia-lyase n=1 Tax=Imperialibacter sp. TaxID=2038411 RepID=UPI003A8BBABB